MITEEILQNVVFPCTRGSYIYSERPSLEGVHAYLCAKEITSLLENCEIFLDIKEHSVFDKHQQGISIVSQWAENNGLKFQKEIDISVGVADVLVYADDTSIFEIGTTRPTKMVLLLKYISKLDGFYTVHFWPYVENNAFIFRNWDYKNNT